MNLNEIEKGIDGEDLTGKVVIIRKDSLVSPYSEGDRRFLAKVGFGCKPGLIGRAVWGIFLVDGEECRMNRSDVEGIAVNQERS